ncbi:peptidoglycan recognition protein 1 [Arachnomyces sp. PD_36]|nr:peptidoglycan recognition protein 1 [Arachnomyces sp. PD_36]
MANAGISAMRASLWALTALSSISLIPQVEGLYFVSREEWGARPPEESYTDIESPDGVKIHYLGESFTAIDHSSCDDFMRQTQDYQMDDSPEGFMDFAYNLAVCQHGYVYDGRGAGHQSGANGDEILNAEHYAIVGFVGNTGVTTPSSDMILGIQDAIAYLRRAGAGDEILGHRDGYSTLCPGEALYGMTEDGTLDPGELTEATTHTVKANDTLPSISRQYNIPARNIITANSLEEPYELSPGDELEIPARGVPLEGAAPPSDGDGEEDPPLEEFPGSDFFTAEPSSPIVAAMGARLVEENCSAYPDGEEPDEQWDDADLESYKLWQEKLGYTGGDADGWPGQSSWDTLKVPAVEG